MDQNLLNPPPLEALRGFVRAARRMRISPAAEGWCLTQSAVSRQIQAVEKSLGTALFRCKYRVLDVHGLGDARAKGYLRFTKYDQLVPAAFEGQGVALGRLALVRPLLDDSRLVAVATTPANAARRAGTCERPERWSCRQGLR